jgi:hypothetical protein
MTRLHHEIGHPVRLARLKENPVNPVAQRSGRSQNSMRPVSLPPGQSTSKREEAHPRSQRKPLAIPQLMNELTPGEGDVTSPSGTPPASPHPIATTDGRQDDTDDSGGKHNQKQASGDPAGGSDDTTQDSHSIPERLLSYSASRFSVGSKCLLGLHLDFTILGVCMGSTLAFTILGVRIV